MIFLLIVLGFLLYFAERYSMAHVLDKLTFETETDRILVEPGECFCWKFTISNGKRMMVPYLKVKELMPEGLFFETGEPPQSGVLISTLYLAGRQKAELRRDVSLPCRGRYFFRGASVEAGDFLGYQNVTASYPEIREMVVKPKPSPSAELSGLLGGFLGEHAVRQGLMEDPIHIVGFREYTGREPFRAISWSQSARNRRLLVKQYENTMDFSCSVLLLVSDNGEEGRGERLEACFSIVRSVCEELERQRLAYDFRTNGSIAGAMGSWNQVGEGLGHGHLEAVLEGLGRMTYDRRENEEAFIEREIRMRQGKRSFIMVVPEQRPFWENAAERLKRASGREVLLLCAEEMGGSSGSLYSERTR